MWSQGGYNNKLSYCRDLEYCVDFVCVCVCGEGGGGLLGLGFQLGVRVRVNMLNRLGLEGIKGLKVDRFFIFIMKTTRTG